MISRTFGSSVSCRFAVNTSLIKGERSRFQPIPFDGYQVFLDFFVAVLDLPAVFGQILLVDFHLVQNWWQPAGRAKFTITVVLGLPKNQAGFVVTVSLKGRARSTRGPRLSSLPSSRDTVPGNVISASMTPALRALRSRGTRSSPARRRGQRPFSYRRVFSCLRSAE